MAVLDESYPQEAWTHVYTDGSAKDAIKDGGAGVHIRYPTGDIEENKAPTGTNCSTYKAEVEALKLAMDMIAEIEETQVVFLTDARSMFQAMVTEKERELTNKLADLSKQKRVALQWIPTHCGIPGNKGLTNWQSKAQETPSQHLPSASAKEKRLQRINLKTISTETTTTSSADQN